MSGRRDRYDKRRGQNYDDHRQRDRVDGAHYDSSQRRPPSTRERSRSRSPDAEKGRLEQERRARMARLRAENEEEERRLAALELQDANEEKKPQPKEQFVRVDEEELKDLGEEEQMKRLIGFSGGFASTKGKEVEDNSKSAAKGAAAKNKARKYRQYMNRKGGFNRPLDKMD